MNTIKNFKMVWVLAFAIILAPAVALGQKPVSLSFGAKTWISSGSSDWSEGGVGGVPNVLSELKWDDVDSVVVELTAEAVYSRFILRISGGVGDIGGGTLEDKDYLGDDRTQLFSDSLSTADEDGLLSVSGDVGYRLLGGGKGEGFLDLLFGGQYWKERYIATEFVQVTPATGAFADQGKGITEDFKWTTIRIGARGEIPLFHDFSFRGGVFFIPWSKFTFVDIHHFRTDLEQNPSFKASVSGGFGFQIDAALTFDLGRHLLEGLSVEAGYQYWYLDSGDGEITAKSVTAGDVKQPFNGATTTRHGATAGISYRFRL